MTRTFLRFLNAPLLLFLVAIGIGIQSSLFANWPLRYFQPDLGLLIIIWCALRRSFAEGGILSLMVADMCEIHSAAPQGLSLISYIAIYLLVRSSSRYIVLPTRASYSMVTLASSVIHSLINLIVLMLLGVGSPLKNALTYLFVNAAVEALFSIWVFRGLDRLDWITYKHARTEHADEEVLLEDEGF